MIKYIILCVIVTVSQARVVPFLDPCRPTDSDCILKSSNIVMANIINGYKPLGIPSLNPFVYNDTITMDTGELKLSINNIVSYDTGTCTINKIERDIATSSILLITDCLAETVGNYEMKGKLLTIDVDGKGPFELKGGKVRYTINMKIEKIEENSVEHYKVKNYDFKHELLSKLVLHLGNLFNGDQSKAAPVEKLLEENTNALMSSEIFGRPLVEKILTPLIKLIDIFIQSLPVNEFEIV